MTARQVCIACALCLCVACGRQTDPTRSRASASAAPASASRVAAPQSRSLVESTRLTQLGVSAYHVSLALDGDVVYLLTSNAAYRLLAGQPAEGIQLDLGIGAVLTHSAFVFWSKGHIWRAPKDGGATRQIAKFPHQPQYFVTSGDAFAWIDLNDDGLFTIQTLDGRRPKVLVSSPHELSALAMIHDSIYFVERPTDASWRIGVVRTTGDKPEYGPERKGRRPSMFAASESIYYYDVDEIEIRRLVGGVQQEEMLLQKFVCSPIHVSSRIYCACVEGVFEVSKETRQPRVLSPSRSGPITNITSNEKMVVWAVDTGRDQMAVDMLPVQGADAKPTK
jgi:hypothetical protein